MNKEISNAKIVFTRKVERVLSEILSDEHDCNIKIHYLPEEYGDGVIPPNHELRLKIDPVNGDVFDFFPIEPEEGDEKHESGNKRTNRKICSSGS